MPIYVWFILACGLSLVVGAVASFCRYCKKPGAEVRDPDLLLASRIVECIAGLVGTLQINAQEALRTTAIRLNVFSVVPFAVSDFLFTLSTVWSDDIAPDRVTIRPEEVQVILLHATDIRSAQAALLELFNRRMAIPK